MNTTSLILKQEGLGRVRTPAARREELLVELAAGIKVQLHHASQVPLAGELLRNLARPC